MTAVELVLALEFQAALMFGLVLVIALMLGLLVPFLYREIQKGKAERVGKPIGADETRPGPRGNPAPGQPDGQASPYHDVHA